MNAPALLVQILREPARAAALDREAWQDLVWQARSTELMAQLQAALQAAGVWAQVPVAAAHHLQLAATVAERHQHAVASELRSLWTVLAPLGQPVILLKGAAYGAQGLQASVGRIYNDIDLLVPKPCIVEAERRLSNGGWIGQHVNAYDQRYYREWMHEIPPMAHKHRGSTLDVHHTILPPTSGIPLNTQSLFEASQPAPAPWAEYRVLQPADQVLHSAAHLFFGEFHKGLRDLYDLHQLLSQFAGLAGFWDSLAQRAAQHGLQQPLADALRHTQRLFGTACPAGLVDALLKQRRSRWPSAARDWLFEHGLRPQHPSARTSKLAIWLLFVRSHWQRMPVPLLAYHLTHKALWPS